MRIFAWISRQIATLYPGCFALVMATGIISNGLFFEDHHGWSNALFAFELIAYPWLVLLTILRCIRFRQEIWADLVNPSLVFSFFTTVAATDVLGIGMALRGFENASIVLWLFALVLWIGLI